MDGTSWSFEAIGMITLFLMSAFFSGSETAMMAVNRIRLRHQMRKQKRARRLARILKEPEKLLGTLLLCNNLVNVALSAIGTELAVRYWGEHGVVIATFTITALLLIFSEITPKTLAAYYPEAIALRIAPLITLCIRLLYPVVRIMSFISKGIITILGLRPKTDGDHMTEEEIRSVIEVGGDEGTLDQTKHDMLIGVLGLEETTVGDIMIPLRDVVMVALEAPYQQIIQVIRESQVSRYPVYQGNRNNVIGFFHVRDFLLASFSASFSLRRILREPDFVPDLRSIRHQLIDFQATRTHLSIVVDEYGNVRGIITLEDILEEIVGEIQDEHDSLARRVEKLPDGSFRIDGTVLLRDLNRWLHLSLPDEEVRTIGGFILKKLDRMPSVNDVVEVDGYRLQVEEVKRRSIIRVRLWIPHRRPEPEQTR